MYIKLRRKFDEPLLHLRLRAFLPTVLSRVNIFSVFDMFFCPRSCDKVKVFCRYCSAVNVVKLDDVRIFQDIVINERDFTEEFIRFFARRSIFTLNLSDSHLFWISEKQHCLKFEQQKRSQQLFIYFLSILIKIYVNTFFQINLKNDFGLTEDEAETYRKYVFRSAYALMFSFCLNCHFKPFFAIFDTFSPITDFNCRCFKILNFHELKFVEAKENYISKHFEMKILILKNFRNLEGRWEKITTIKKLLLLMIIKFSLTKKIHITRFTNLLSEHMKEKSLKVKLDFYVSKRKNYVHMGLGSPLFLYMRNQQITDELWSFISDELDKRFKPMFPQLIATVKWKMTT